MVDTAPPSTNPRRVLVKWFIIALILLSAEEARRKEEKHTMSLKKFLILTSVVALAASLVGTLHSTAAAAPLEQNDLLQNPSFEPPYTDNDQQATGWDHYRIKIDKPTDASALQYSVAADFSAETNPSGKFPELIHGGSASQHIGKQQDPWIAGVRQVVSNIPPNSQVSFCAFARIYANNDKYGKAPSVNGYEGRAQVGIYPDGDVSVDTAGIAWSPVANPHDTWQQICTSATVGASGKVTVFTRNDWRGYAAVHLDAWWDDASLTIQGQAQPTTPPQPQQPQATTPPQPQVQATPNAQGAIVHTVVAGDTLFALSFQYNVPLDEIYALNGLNSQSILSIGQQIIIKAGPGTQVPAQPTAAPTAAPEAAQPTPAGTPNTAQTPAASDTTPVVEPTATAAQVAVNANKLCVLAFNDTNGDGIRQPDEAPVAGASFKIIDAQGSSVATYTSSNESDPHCFTDLAAGSYTVDVQPAPGTSATSDKRWGVALTSGSTVNINFGSEGGGTTDANTQPEAAPEKSSGGSSIGGLLGGAIGLILLLVAGVLGAFIIARRRA
jgi:LysM repeat protein